MNTAPEILILTPVMIFGINQACHCEELPPRKRRAVAQQTIKYLSLRGRMTKQSMVNERDKPLILQSANNS